MTLYHNRKAGFTLLLLLFSSPVIFAGAIDIKTCGAKDDGTTVNTVAIQKAIDFCSEKGGTVVVPSGVFVTGTVYLKKNVTLLLEKGAELLGSANPEDYPANTVTSLKCTSTHSSSGKSKENRALIFAESQDNISIMGEGTINGNGNNAVFQKGDNGHDRPKLLFFISCKNVVIKDILLTNSAFWTQDYLGCDGVRIQGIRVLNHANWNEDGIDIDSKNVVVSDCIIDSDDDAICLKSYVPDLPVENVTITNCVISTNCNAIKFGTPGFGGFKNVTISNCAINASKYSNFRNWTKRYKNITTDPSMVSGISIECVDGGHTESILINNITMKGTQTPIFIKVANRNKKVEGDNKRASSMRNIVISNIIAEVHSRRTSSITAYPGTNVENVKLHHMIFDVISTSSLKESDIAIKENEGGYPSTHMLGEVLPANGFYVRHVKDISIEDIQINLKHDDDRYAVVFDDTRQARVNNITVKDTAGFTRSIVKENLKVTGSSDIFLNDKKIE